MIGVSFTGYDGKTKTGVARTTSELRAIMGDGGSRVERMRQQVESAQDKLMGKQFKFEKPDAIDGPLIGIEGNDSLKPDGQSRSVGAMGGWRIPITRTEMDVKPSLEMKCNEVTLVKLQYDLIISEKGFVKGRTEERVVWSKKFFADGDSGKRGDGKWGCRLIYGEAEGDKVHPIPYALTFGSDKDLDTYDNDTGRFGCNYAEDGSVLDDPPVKVVAIESTAFAES